MKRQKSTSRRPKRKKAAAAASPPDAHEPGRRTFLARLRTAGLLAGAAGLVGWYLVSEVTATIAEHDLSRIGNGRPAVVQVHDPQCPRCLALQRETRAALKAIGDSELQYLIANIRSAEGRQLADRHGVEHVTLLLFDANGRRTRILAGANTSANLAGLFKAHLRRGGAD